jgi:hypothetical protein
LIETGPSYEEGLERLAAACLSRRALPLEALVPAVVADVMAGLNPNDDLLFVGVEM